MELRKQINIKTPPDNLLNKTGTQLLLQKNKNIVNKNLLYFFSPIQKAKPCNSIFLSVLPSSIGTVHTIQCKQINYYCDYFIIVIIENRKAKKEELRLIKTVVVRLFF